MLILTNPNQTPSKDKYNKLIKMTAGNVELTDEVLYCVGYDIFCSNIVALKEIQSKQETIQELKAKCEKLTIYYVVLCDEIAELQKENAELKSKLSLKEQK